MEAISLLIFNRKSDLWTFQTLNESYSKAVVIGIPLLYAV